MRKTYFKPALTTICIIVFAAISHSQGIYETISLDQAIKKSGASGKLVFAAFLSEKCDRCNEQIEKVLSDDRLAAVISKRCIPIKIGFENKDRQRFSDSYNPAKSVGLFFISGDAELIHAFPGITEYELPDSNLVHAYLQQIDKAFSIVSEGRAGLAELDAEWNRNPQDFIAMEKNLERRRALSLPTDSLLDVYITRLPIDSLSSPRVLNVIQRNAPPLFSKADAVMRKDIKLFNQVWYTMDLPTRISINRRIGRVSLKRAIEDRNRSEAFQVAKFTASTHENNPAAAEKAIFYTMIKYFKEVKDTVESLRLTVYYLNRYYLSQSLDSLKKKDSIYRKRVVDSIISKGVDTSDYMSQVMYKKSFDVLKQGFAGTLNDGAWYIYITSKQSYYLRQALEFAKRSVELYESADALDTYARLLYITGKTIEGVEQQQRAITLLRQQKYNTKDFEEALSKMKRGEPLNDLEL